MNEILIDINLLLDNRNQVFYNQIIANNITVTVIRKINGKKHWEMFYNSMQGEVKILAGKKFHDMNSFTHELLHVIQEINGYSTLETLHTLININYSPFNRIFDNSLIGHINNVIHHQRILSPYLNANFKRNKFLFDYYNKIIFKEKHLQNIVIDNFVCIPTLRIFIFNYFSYRFHPNAHVKLFYQHTFLRDYQIKNSELINTL